MISYKNVQKITNILILVGLATLFLSNLFSGLFEVFVFVVGILIMLSAAPLIKRYLKCPHCDKNLPWNLYRPEHCNHCGRKIDFE